MPADSPLRAVLTLLMPIVRKGQGHGLEESRGIRNKLCLEREMVEKLSRMIYKDPILTSILGKNKIKTSWDCNSAKCKRCE